MSGNETYGSLTLVGTPIGNLSDFSPRAVEALKAADTIAAEDTRVTLKLLNHFGIKKPLVSYFEHNKKDRGAALIERMKNGENFVLVSDAGMPAISDPGEDLVAACHEVGIPVTVVPGPTAMATAIAISGLPTGRFTFEGFLSVNKPSRKKHLEELVDETRTMIFYEAPHKLRATLRDMSKVFGEDRRISLVRELTKIHEEVVITTLGKAAASAVEKEPRGEYVLVIEGKKVQSTDQASLTLEESVLLARKFAEEGLPLSQAAKQAASESGFAKSEIYKELVKEK